MIIDFHVHIFPPEMVSNRERFFDDEHFAALYASEKSKLVGREALCAMMDEQGIERAVAMAFPFANDAYRKQHNEYILEASLATGGRIIPFVMPPIDDIDGMGQWLDCAKKNGAAGIGEVAFYSSGFGNKEQQYLEAILRAASQANLPVCIHVNEPVGHRYPGKYSNSFELLYEIITKNQRTKIILAHWGGGLFFYELMKEVRESLKHVWYDTAATPFLYEETIYRIARDIIGSEKIVFGSDYPLISPARYLHSIRNFFDDHEREYVVSRNALSITAT
jgi:predicted TIM-barrel fold metal-dependent hydrolase